MTSQFSLYYVQITLTFKIPKHPNECKEQINPVLSAEAVTLNAFSKMERTWLQHAYKKFSYCKICNGMQLSRGCSVIQASPWSAEQFRASNPGLWLVSYIIRLWWPLASFRTSQSGIMKLIRLEVRLNVQSPRGDKASKRNRRITKRVKRNSCAELPVPQPTVRDDSNVSSFNK